MKFLILNLILIQLICSVICAFDNYVNLTIYNNLNYTIAVTDFEYKGDCYNKCDYIQIEPCKSK